MKKFITVVPLQPEGKLDCYHYGAVGNPRLEMEEKTSFPILTALQGYVEPGEHSQLIALRTENDNARRNFAILEGEVQALCQNRGLEVPEIVVLDIPEDEAVSTHVDTFRKLIDLLGDGDELFGCLTYGTKPLSEVVRIAIQYAYRVKDNTSISGLVYGHVIRTGERSQWYGQVQDETALLRLDEIVRMLADQGVKNPGNVLDTLLAL